MLWWRSKRATTPASWTCNPNAAEVGGRSCEIRTCYVAEVATKATATAVVSDAPFEKVVAELSANRQAVQSARLEDLGHCHLNDQQVHDASRSVMKHEGSNPQVQRLLPRRQRSDDQCGVEHKTTGCNVSTTNCRQQLQTAPTVEEITHEARVIGRAAGITCFNCRRRGEFGSYCRGDRHPAFNYPGQSEFLA